MKADVEKYKKDDRINSILSLVLKLTGDKISTKKIDESDRIDLILKGLKNLEQRQNENSLSNDRINQLVELLIRYTVMDFSKKAPISERGDEIDAIAAGLNTLIEELEFLIKEKEESNLALEKSNAAYRESNALLKINEQRIQSILDNAPDAIMTTDLKFNILEWNKAAEKIYGYTREEVLGKCAEDIITTLHVAPNTRESVKEQLNKIGKWRGEMIQSTKIKRGIIVLSSISFLKDGDGRITGVLGINRDVTDLKNIEEELRVSENQAQTIFNNAPDAIIVMNREGKITRWNPKAEEMFGWKQGEVVGNLLHDFIIPMRYREAHLKGMERFLETGHGPVLNKTIEIKGLTKQKKEFDVSLSISALKTTVDNFLFIAFVRDITGVKTIEEELRKSEEHYHTLVNEVTDYAIVLLDTNGYITTWNKGAKKIKGYTEKEIIGKHFSVFYTEGDKSNKIPNINLETARRKGRHLFTGWRVRKDGNYFWADVVLTALKDSNGNITGFVKITRDLTEQRKIETELLQKTEELKRSNLELEQFAYVASHDLQEPLRMVSSYVQLLAKRYKDKLDEEANDFIDFAVDGSNRMRLLINSLLEYSRVSRIKPFEQINVSDLIDQICKDLSVQIKETGAVIKYNALPEIYGDTVLIWQLFQNLISNSLKFRSEKTPEIIITASADNDYYLFTIKDNGIGMQKEYVDKIFVIFQRLHAQDKYPGTGIGLAICKKIVERHGGKIWVESEPGKGASFHCTIKNKKPQSG